MKVRVVETIGSLVDDLTEVGTKLAIEAPRVVQEGARVGNDLAKDFAKRSSGRHARKYPGTFTAQKGSTYRGFGAAIYQAEYGPNARGQGLLAPILERGSRNNKAHLDLARSADIIGPALAREVGEMMDRIFW